jgi:ABC-type Zn uptake system ZnuABC Zn-binding protein ZnuA
VVTTSTGIGLIGDTNMHDDVHGTDEAKERANPHIWLDPANAVTMTRHITEALIQADSAHAEDYRGNQAAYLKRLDQVRTELTDRVRTLTERRFIAHHPAWPYLARRFGFDIVGTIQLQSISEPSARHIQDLIDLMKKKQIKVVVSEIQLSQKFPELLAKEAGARVVVLTTLPGGLPQTETYLDMLRYNVLQLANALSAA